MTYQQGEKIKHLQDIFGYDLTVQQILDDLINALGCACDETIDPREEARWGRHIAQLRVLEGALDPE